ncbi:hypothetical protein BB559_003857 [Furculomyces boomerangus]|uniref:Protein kinase domain-containing protein n=1 Tax=Furculomyces boomerangus TaxID=61424 RepID=A0A2T9YIB7_9FUNG|nr:hypothetical protein BB559_003857 [Furculomyces boomerangus]
MKEEKEKRKLDDNNSKAPQMPIRMGEILKKQKENEEKTDFYLIRHELAVHKKLKHPHIVKLYEVLDDDENDAIFMVFDYCENGPLFEINPENPVEPMDDVCARINFVQALMGLEYLHENGIVHGDIKPSNMLLTKDRLLKITDFDTSRIIGKRSSTNENSGTPAFMSPVSVSVKGGECSSDLWALGVSLYCMAFGVLPFNGKSAAEVSNSVLNDQLVFPENADPRLCNLLERMLDKDFKTRATMAEIRVHPWVTNDGNMPLPTKEENCVDLVANVSQEELNHLFKNTIHITPVVSIRPITV